MVNADVGTIIKKDTLRDGVHEEEKWMFGIVYAEKGYDKIQVWANNPSELDKNSDLVIEKITSVAMKAKKYKTKDGEEKWDKEVVIQANLKPVDNTSPVEGFARLDESIPF